jgi:hypothetical protein
MARASFTIIYDVFFLTPTTFTADQADAARNDLMVSLSNISTMITSCQSTLLQHMKEANIVQNLAYAQQMSVASTLCNDRDRRTTR